MSITSIKSTKAHKPTIIDEYLEKQEYYEKKYGENTVVLMEVGGFFEIYSVINDDEQRGRIYEVADITNLNVSKKNDKHQPVSRSNPLMAGFPSHSFEKWKDILLKHDYTIIKMEQEAHGGKGFNRSVTEIISQGVNIDSTNFSNAMMSVVIEEMKDHKINKPILCVGISIIDITTGESVVYETHSSADDFKFALDEVFRFIQAYSPSEALFHTFNVSMTKDDIVSYLELSNINVHFNIYDNENYKHLLQNKFKIELLKKVYPSTGMLTPIEYIDLERSPFALNSYIYLIQFTYEHNENIIQKLHKPKIWEPTKYLILSHDSIVQLNVVPDKSRQQSKGISSLWDIVDKTNTPIGRRLLRDNLLNPILNTDELNKRYILIEKLMPNYGTFKTYLKNISDIERLHRKMSIKMINPASFVNLDMSYTNILHIIKYINESNIYELVNILPSTDVLNKFNEFIIDYKDKLRIDCLSGTSLNNLTDSIFKKGLYDEIEVIMDEINNCNLFFSTFANQLVQLFEKNPTKDLIESKNNERDGFYLSITNTRATLLKKAIGNLSNKNIQFNINTKNYNIDLSKLEIKPATGSSKIYHECFKTVSDSLVANFRKLNLQTEILFNNLILEYSTKYDATLTKITNFVAYIDFLISAAQIATENGYSKPKINIDSEQSYIKACDLRHPIIEKINNQIQYVANDIHLGIDGQNGILLFGLNCVGKSTMMKSVGLATIMAQCGLYVPAKSFEYSPYKYLFTRISSNDNLFKGQSTFAVEMSELRAILKRTNKNALVLGDELCSGTETTSALAIVTAGVMRLCQKNSSFIFTTHLHKLAEMDEIKSCSTVNSFHMETLYDESTKKLIYNRKLQPGNGSAIYGLEVARAMDLDDEFIGIANNVRKRIMGISDQLVGNKTSQFNANVIINCCSICKSKTEEVHHINEQQFANQNGMIDYFHKNNLFNLVQLCHKCHNDVHNGKLIIDGYVQTSNGVELQHKYSESKSSEIKANKKKYTKSDIDLIKNKYTTHKAYSLVKKDVETNHKMKISIATIKQIVLGEY